MTLDTDLILRTLRTQAWERAKGELKSMAHTFYGQDVEKFEALDAEIEMFILKVESSGLQE